MRLSAAELAKVRRNVEPGCVYYAYMLVQATTREDGRKYDRERRNVCEWRHCYGHGLC